MKKTFYSPLSNFEYKDGIFGAGLVKNSKHPINKVYLQINKNIFELRDDEIHAVISTLTMSLWCHYQYTKQDKIKLKWQTKEDLEKLFEQKSKNNVRGGH